MTRSNSDLTGNTAIVRRPVKLVEHPTFRRWRSESAHGGQTLSAVGLASLAGGRLVGACNPSSSTPFAS